MGNAARPAGQAPGAGRSSTAVDQTRGRVSAMVSQEPSGASVGADPGNRPRVIGRSMAGDASVRSIDTAIVTERCKDVDELVRVHRAYEDVPIHALFAE